MLPKFLKPYHVKLSNLIRIGPKTDGGYVLDKRIINKTKILITCGLNDDWEFEKSFLQRNPNIKIIAFDHTVNRDFWVKRFKKDIMHLLLIKKLRISKILDIFKFIIDLNLVGTFNVMRLGAELIDVNNPDDKGEKGVIINTASIAGYEGQIGQSAYAASKAGVIGMTLTSARDLARHSIRVCTIAPGIFDTPLMALAKDENKEALLKSTQFPHRFGDVKEYAQLAEHIINNTYLNGETIRLDSAMRMEAK